tara:strand:- start:2168 stop:2326 length:159 start_codon:yes stop_codon:yes gene_type:complete
MAILTVASLEGATVRCLKQVDGLKGMVVLGCTMLVDAMDALTPVLNILNPKE